MSSHSNSGQRVPPVLDSFALLLARDSGFAQRLETVAGVLQLNAADDSFESWQALAEQPQPAREFHAALAFLLAVARYPHPEEIRDFTYRWEQSGFIESVQAIFASSEYARLARGATEYRLFVPDADRLFVDISNTLFSSHLSGIQRVVRCLCHPWVQNNAPVEFFVMRNDAPRPSLITADEQHYYLNWTKTFGTASFALGGLRSRIVPDKATDGQLTSKQRLAVRVARRARVEWHRVLRRSRAMKHTVYGVLTDIKYYYPGNASPLREKPWVLQVPVFTNHRLLLPELCDLTPRSDFYLTVKHSMPQTRMSMILYDFIPLWYPEHAGIAHSYLEYLRLLRVADKISCISADIERQTRHMVACIRDRNDPREIVIATHDLPGSIGSENAPVAADTVEGTATRESLPYVLCVGTVESRKNQRTLLHACLNLMKQGTRFRLIFAGNPGWKAQKFVADLYAAQNQGFEVEIKISVPEKELIELYRNCAFTVFCSYAEGFGLPIVESLRFGKAVVVSDRGCMRDIGDRLGGCYFIEPDRQETIENAIRLLLSDKSELDKLTASIHFEGWPDWNDYANQLLQFSLKD